jgi:hypothetical protein
MMTAASAPLWKSRFVGPFHLMAVLLVGTYVALAFLPDDGEAGPAGIPIALVTCGTMLLGIRAACCPKSNFRMAEAIVALIVVSLVLDRFRFETYDAARLLFAVLSFIAIKTILTSVLRADRVDADKIFAAICVLFLLGWFWSYLYVFLDTQSGHEAFSGSGHEHAPEGEGFGRRERELVYFSFVTLTTLGYGDIVPKSELARVLATLQALTGQLYLAVLIARLVALHIVHSHDEAKDAA